MKTAIVTGASKGLGAQIARKLRESGIQVLDWSRTAASPVDVRNSSQVQKMAANVLAEKGKIDILINNAGLVQPLLPFEQTSDEDLLNAFKTNVFGPFYTMRSVVPSMVKRNEGIIVNVASKSAIFAVPKLAAYSSSKSALVTLTQAVAKELRNTSVVCVAICPAGMRGSMRASVYGSENAEEQQGIQRVADIVYEIVSFRTAERRPVSQGSSIIIRKDRVEIREMQDE